jgi:hypothetical protein
MVTGCIVAAVQDNLLSYVLRTHDRKRYWGHVLLGQYVRVLAAALQQSHCNASPAGPLLNILSTQRVLQQVPCRGGVCCSDCGRQPLVLGLPVDQQHIVPYMQHANPLTLESAWGGRAAPCLPDAVGLAACMLVRFSFLTRFHMAWLPSSRPGASRSPLNVNDIYPNAKWSRLVAPGHTARRWQEL